MTILEAQNLDYGAGKTPLIRNLSFELQVGERLLIRGQNGVGKSTLLKVLLGQMKPLSGTVRLDVPSERIAYLPQLQNTEFHIPVTLGDVLNFSCRKRIEPHHVDEIGLLKSSDLSRGWNTASGGERQKTLLTRIFLQESDLIVLDEPMNHLDSDAKEQVRKLIEKFVSKTKQRSMLIVCHDQIDDGASMNEDSLFRSLILKAVEP